MPAVEIGSRTIEYLVRRSERVTRKRIEVTPSSVEVIVPEGDSDKEIRAFVRAKRRWLHDKTEEVEEKAARLRARTPEGFHSGAKVLYRGRHLRLKIESADVDEPDLTYRTAFHVDVPKEYSDEERVAAAQRLIHDYFDERLSEDAWAIVRDRGEPHDLVPRGIRLKDQKTLWGSCGEDGVLRLDRRLIRLPKPVLEYVVVHELCHLSHRDHSPKFWALVKKILPDYEERKEWLEEHEMALG